jgi:hypothetical protein
VSGKVVNGKVSDAVMQVTARNEIGQVVAKTKNAVKRAAGKFPTGGGLTPECATTETDGMPIFAIF